MIFFLVCLFTIRGKHAGDNFVEKALLKNMQVITAFGIGEVMGSKESNYKVGDIIINPFCPIAEYCVIPADSPIIRKIDPSPGIPLPEYVSSLGRFMLNFAYIKLIYLIMIFQL